jgi:hypothetical protein
MHAINMTGNLSPSIVLHILYEYMLYELAIDQFPEIPMHWISLWVAQYTVYAENV